jgi:hypothetical protein
MQHAGSISNCSLVCFLAGLSGLCFFLLLFDGGEAARLDHEVGKQNEQGAAVVEGRGGEGGEGAWAEASGLGRRSGKEGEYVTTRSQRIAEMQCCGWWESAHDVWYVYGCDATGEGARGGVEEDVDALTDHANELKRGYSLD